MVLAAVKNLMAGVLGEVRQRALRIPDSKFYQQQYFEERLKSDTHARFSREMADWEANGSVPANKPVWLTVAGAVTKEHWDAESAEFREQMRVANELDYQQRLAVVNAFNEKTVMQKPTTPQEYES